MKQKSKTEEEIIASLIFYSPATNGKAEQSIKDGAKEIRRFASQEVRRALESLKRYDISGHDSSRGLIDVNEDKDGDWIKREEIELKINELNK